MIILGSTGSIGTQALQILKTHNISPEVLVCGQNIDTLIAQIKEHSPKIVVIKNASDAEVIRRSISASEMPKVLHGQEGIKDALLESSSPVVLNALVGLSGLLPTIHALKLGKKLLLANKESLVTIGHLIKHHMERIVPIDSEHFSIAYLLGYFTQKQENKLSEIIITSSGGALRDVPLETIPCATKEQVLSHPNWSMGNKITIDSATMVNKLFEILECLHLFEPFLESSDKISAIIERSSLIHALIRDTDGSLRAHVSAPSMMLPLSYAIIPSLASKSPVIPPLALSDFEKIEFRKIDPARYPLYALKDELLKNPKKGALLNSANEILNAAFLHDEISFGDISRYILKAFEKFHTLPELDSLEEILEFDTEVARFIKSLL